VAPTLLPPAVKTLSNLIENECANSEADIEDIHKYSDGRKGAFGMQYVPPLTARDACSDDVNQKVPSPGLQQHGLYSTLLVPHGCIHCWKGGRHT